jgi:hypothetical protein
MDVILDSYSRSMKVGGSSAGVRRTSEQNEQSSDQHVEDSRVISQEPASGTMNRPVLHTDLAIGAQSRPLQSNSGAEHGIANLAAHVGRASLNTSSDSEDIANTSRAVSPATSGATSKRPQAIGEDSRPLASGASMQHGTHVTSVAISPIEMFQYVFLLVEDEMMGDPAYLIAVIMEFLRRYLLVLLKSS